MFRLRLGISYLHSTMVLLIRISSDSSISRISIYIPLWFYLYPTSRQQIKPLYAIYIPLWFNLYRNCREALPSVYGIYIPLWFYLYYTFHKENLSHYLFTFHYGSTYTIRWSVRRADTCSIYIPLWFYLYPVYESSVYSFIYIYIPLWFYLYGKCG